MRVLLLIPLALLAACGTTTPRVDDLAGATTPPPVVSSTAPPTTMTKSATTATAMPPDPVDTDTAAGRPQFRLDDTEDRRTALINAYSQCLLDHGAKPGGRNVPGAQPVPGGSGGKPFIQVADPVPDAAKSACADKLPLMPPQTEASTNPDFHAQSLAYVACLKSHGEWVQLLNDHNLDWTYVAGHPVPEDNATFEQSCLVEAFS